MNLAELPIDAVLPDIRAAIAAKGAVVVEAPPGAGKTTRVPRALLDTEIGQTGEIWVLEPRRLPARLAAARVAAELGEKVGETVGYSVRFEEVAGPKTRLRFLTEGLFLRRMLAQPQLPGVAAVVLDELHERHVATDLALAWLRHLRDTGRERLAVVAMSATLDAGAVQQFLAGERGECGLVRSEGRLYDVAVEHLPNPDERPLGLQVAAAVRRVLREERDGDVLVFLPGAADIRHAQNALGELPVKDQVVILPLHGEMPLEEQVRAVRPAERRKVVLATNVAESSITIDGVVAVIDSGLARIAGHSPWTGLPTLSTAKISQSSAVQRAGRAGRTRAGRALRLYTRHDFEQRRVHELPEVARADLAETVMALAALEIGDPDAIAWLEAPPAASYGAARELLRRLGAIDESGLLTPVGKQMSRLPIDPRLARLVVEGAARGARQAACLAAALISERDIRVSSRAAFTGRGGAGDDRGAEITDLVDLFKEAEEQRFDAAALRRLELDRRAVDEVNRVRRVLTSSSDASGRSTQPAQAGPRQATVSESLRLAVLAAFPDRVGRQRDGDARTMVLAAGGAAALGFEPSGKWLVAVDVEERRTTGRHGPAGTRTPGVQVRLGSTIEPEWLLDLFADRIEEIDRRAFNPETRRVERTTGLQYGAVALEETTETAPPDEETARLLAEGLLSRGPDHLPGGPALGHLLERLAFARENVPDAPLPPVAADDLAGLVRLACTGRASAAELEAPGADLGALVLATLSPEGRRALDTIAPERITLAGGRTVPVHYAASGPPWIESRLQDFFGTRAVPTLGGGRVPVTVHLLAPNGRAVQVTRDLSSFWTQHYPALRRELGRRYPRHPWPEDGATARPPPPLPPNRRR